MRIPNASVRRVPYRVQPKMPVQAYQTFGLKQPLATHWRRATCEEVGCKKYLKGWKTTFVPGTPKGEQIRHTIKTSPIKRKYTVLRLADRIEVVFEPGQQCFLQDHPTTAHKTTVGRPQIHVVRRGDWRQGWDGRTVSPSEWLDRFVTNQDKLSTLIQRG